MGLTESKWITVLATSDIHGHIHPTDYRGPGKRNLGLAKLASLIHKERGDNPDLLLLDNGDLIQGSPLASYAIKTGTRIHPAVAALNELDYDAAVPGNHEFNYGLWTLDKAVKDSRFPWLSAGIAAAGSTEPAFGKPYLIKMIDEIKIAILGVTTHYIPNWENPLHIEGLEFHDALAAVKEWVPRIRREERPDVLIVAYHGGFERDIETGEPAGQDTGENQGYAMCIEVEGIDVLITGHQHRLIAGEVNGVTVVQPGFAGQALGKISVELVLERGRFVIRDKRAELLKPDSSLKPDAAVLGLSRELEEETQRWLDQPIGRSDGGMILADPFVCRLAEHPFIEFVNRVQMDCAGVEVSCTALLSEESKGFGEIITRRDVLTNFMYPNTLTVLKLTGGDIRAALEQTARYFELGQDGKPAVNPEYLSPKVQHYNYDMWEGIEYTLNIVKPPGQRVVRLLYKGEDLRDETELDVVLNSYRAGGGGDYDMFRGKPVVREIMTESADLVEEYIAKLGSIPAVCNHNWEVVWEN
ncbi:5'-nucleotidase C-terminal domain-containing protein [Paenibacillus sp. M1]|uniref:5'-nucleotidase C-terminal domain-containing protein n=1 Tax=Paenibacillus haidiansis TaxID=1574488 RepID=A0ABU7VU39_9BACL